MKSSYKNWFVGTAILLLALGAWADVRGDADGCYGVCHMVTSTTRSDQNNLPTGRGFYFDVDSQGFSSAASGLPAAGAVWGSADGTVHFLKCYGVSPICNFSGAGDAVEGDGGCIQYASGNAQKRDCDPTT